MITETQIILKADNGKWLTNGETFGKVVYVGINDSVDNWHEITDEEKAQFENAEILANGNKTVTE